MQATNKAVSKQRAGFLGLADICAIDTRRDHMCRHEAQDSGTETMLFVYFFFLQSTL